MGFDVKIFAKQEGNDEQGLTNARLENGMQICSTLLAIIIDNELIFN